MHGNCQQTDHRWRQCLLLLLLLVLWGCSGTAVWHHLACLPMSASTPHPVLGFWESLQRGTGCTSRGRSVTGQEVHVISLRRGLPANAQVTLVTLDTDPLDKAPIFVLHSQEPVHWMLLSTPGKNWTFQVSPGSTVSAPGPVASAETNFPETLRGLLKWARREHGGVTSLAEYHGVNRIYTRLGAGMDNEDGTAPATCKLRRNFLTPVHFASECRLQPLRICLNSDPPQDLEVHIILSRGVAPSMISSRSSLAHLTVELHAVRRSPRQGLLLILKSEEAAQWMVHAHRLTGRLHVLASHKVIISSTEMDLPLTVTQRTSPGLAVQDPLQYAAEQNLPAFTSYIEAERVNRFILFVGKNEAPSAFLEDPKLFGPIFLPPPRLAVSQQDFSEAITGGWEMTRQDFWGEDGSAVLSLPTAKTEEVESVLCLGDQKPIFANQDIQRVPCVSPSPTQISLPETTVAFQDLPFHLGNALLNLEVYNSAAFAKQPGPCTVSANSLVFVEASLATYDLSLGFTIQQCFISNSSDSSVASLYLLVQHGCAVADAHVSLLESEQAAQGQVLPPGYQERQRLSFVLRPHSNASIYFLHCRLMLCSREPHDPMKTKGPIPKCQSENEACRGEEEVVVRGRFQRTITKPIIVTVGTPFRAATPGLAPVNFLDSQQGKAPKDATHTRKMQPVPTAAAPGLELPAVVGIAFSAFIVGISLAGGLWFIHSQTGEAAFKKRSQSATDRAVVVMCLQVDDDLWRPYESATSKSICHEPPCSDLILKNHLFPSLKTFPQQ
ncbi:transforming growth factor beta receptor type 3-like isoform X2 [Rhineura floridana]|uniref:transforming growth factor beta receptor type 3-like isoform X2 n=1 Tax=Rhineura floridana TaxID=261503 RepID=UPI002AC85FD9|nr:transforming growth factor beta receptor type 3-like isoform X2 [Rhineura floridana]